MLCIQLYKDVYHFISLATCEFCFVTANDQMLSLLVQKHLFPDACPLKYIREKVGKAALPEEKSTLCSHKRDLSFCSVNVFGNNRVKFHGLSTPDISVSAGEAFLLAALIARFPPLGVLPLKVGTSCSEGLNQRLQANYTLHAINHTCGTWEVCLEVRC